jgi:DNA polymerase-3 subunit gamma/tau
MGQALYRQYRPKSLREVVGQPHITDTLAHALKEGKMAHAYLFTGPRGTGKTSIARILAHEINGLPYEADATHLDIIEIDAASNRRIDEIRDLRDKVHTAPSSAKFKVYIIDEVHMLTREAFNALLKTLEEPPAHVVFMLATTEAHKLPETIISRTQRFSLHPVSLDQVTKHLRFIADQEKIDINDKALQLIAAYGEGSFRDSIGLLDQIRGHDGTVEADFVRTLIGIPTTEAIDALRDATMSADTPALVKTLVQLREQGFTAAQVAKHLGQRLRQDIVAGQVQAGVFDLLGALLEVPTKHNPDAFLEICLLGHSLAGQATMAPATVATPQSRQPVTPVMQRSATVAAPSVQAQAQPSPKVTPYRDAAKVNQAMSAAAAEPSFIEAPANLGSPIKVDPQIWAATLDSLKKTYNTLYGIARMARPVFYEGTVELGFTFAFHQKRISEPKNREIVAAAVKEASGQEMAVRCILISKNANPFDDPASASPASSAQATPATQNTSEATSQTASAPSTDVNAISNIFGGAEVLST